MSYAFTTTLLSAAKYSNPQLIGSALSGSGVNIISLSTNDVGIAFTPVATLDDALIYYTIDGSRFAIDTAYAGQQVAVVKALDNNVRAYSVYTINPFLTTVGVTKPYVKNLTQADLAAFSLSVLSTNGTSNGITFLSAAPNNLAVAINVGGNNLFIDTAYHGSEIALISDINAANKTYTIYTLTTALSVQPLSGTFAKGQTDVVDAESRRKWLYGYI
jgi:hypothetical protein